MYYPIGQFFHFILNLNKRSLSNSPVHIGKDTMQVIIGVERCGDAGKAALDLEEKGIKPDVIVVDPPRKGLNADTIEALHRMDPRRIVYVSCDPATLARDVALLKERGYVLKNAMAADLFPRCAHVESIVCLSREKADDYIRISVQTKDLQTKAN